MSIAGGCDQAVLRAQAAGCSTVQLFTKNNNQWNAPPLDEPQITRFRQALDATGIQAPVAHTSYLINLASPDETLWNKSIAALIVEVERCQSLGISDLVVHPGAHMGQGEEAGLTRVAQALDKVLATTPSSNVIIDLETTAGQGSSLGGKLEHLQAILAQVQKSDRLGVCADSCHLFAAGYGLAAKKEYSATIRQMVELLGPHKLRVWHLNDSLKPRGSHVDRHAGIGLGLMSLEPFRNILNDRRFVACRFIMETPKGTMEGEDLDIRNLRILRGLIKSAQPQTT